MNTILKLSCLGLAFAGVVSCGNVTKNETESTSISKETTTGTENESGAKGKMEFEEAIFDFGKVNEGEIVEKVYTFKNTGEAPIILAQVSASCGCTTPSYTKTPVLPGKTGEIKVSFDSNGQVGKQQKIVTVVSNAENGVTTVQLKGEVSPK